MGGADSCSSSSDAQMGINRHVSSALSSWFSEITSSFRDLESLRSGVAQFTGQSRHSSEFTANSDESHNSKERRCVTKVLNKDKRQKAQGGDMP